MRKTVLIFISFFILQCAKPNKDLSGLSVHVKVNGNAAWHRTIINRNNTGPSYFHRKDELYDIDLELANNSDSIISFWEMSCSWQDNWIFNDQRFTLLPYEIVEVNGPVLRSLNPKEKKIYHANILLTDSNITQKNKELKIGFAFVRKQDYSPRNISIPFSDVIEKEKENNIIWSDPFKLSK
jgi:hypothetical protein